MQLDLRTLYQKYRDCFEQHQALQLSCQHHPLDTTYSLNVIDFKPQAEPPENQAFRVYVGSRLVAALQSDNLVIFSTAFPKQRHFLNSLSRSSHRPRNFKPISIR